MTETIFKAFYSDNSYQNDAFWNFFADSAVALCKCIQSTPIKNLDLDNESSAYIMDQKIKRQPRPNIK